MKKYEFKKHIDDVSYFRIISMFQDEVCSYCENNCKDIDLLKFEENEVIGTVDKIIENIDKFNNCKIYSCSEFKEMRFDTENAIDLKIYDNKNTYNYELYDTITGKIICRVPYFTRKGNKKTLLPKADAIYLVVKIKGLIENNKGVKIL